MIIGILGKSVWNKKSFYLNGTPLKIKEGNYINSTHAFLESFENEKFVFLGTKEAIDTHKTSEFFIPLLEKREVKFIEVEANLQKIFLTMMNIILDSKDEEIIFDITHSFRDFVIMSVISTLVTQTLNLENRLTSSKIRMTFAKEVEARKKYTYQLVGQDILNTSNISLLITTFLSTLKVPTLKMESEFYKLLKNFSDHLVSNQFKVIYEKDIPELKNYILKNRENLFFVEPLLKELLEVLNTIENTKEKEMYEKFIFFGEFFLKKDYLLHSSTYLIEAIPLYVGRVLKELHYINFEPDTYKKQQLIVNLLKFSYSKKEFNFPNNYFVEINSKIIKEFAQLRDDLAEIRHNLVHINVKKEYEDIEKKLKKSLEQLKNLIEKRDLYRLTKSQKKKKRTVSYKLEQHLKNMEKFLINSKASMPSIDTIAKKYENNELEKLTMLNMKKTKKYLLKNFSEIKTLIEKRDKKEFLIE